MHIIVVGVPRSGKSSVLSAAEKRDGLVVVLNFGKAMLSVAGKAARDRDRMRYLSPMSQATLGLSAAKRIVERAKW